MRPYGQQPTRLLCPQDSLGKNTGVGCHFLLQTYHYLLSKRWSFGNIWNTLPNFFFFSRFIIFLETGFLILTIVSNNTSFTNIYLRPDTSLVLDQIPKFITLFLCPWDSPGKNTGVGWSPSSGDLPDPGKEPGLSHCRQILYWVTREALYLLNMHNLVSQIKCKLLILGPKPYIIIF